MPNPSEEERKRQEQELAFNRKRMKRPLSKSVKEEILREIRRLERELGITPRDYNGEF